MRATYCALDATRFRRSPSFAIFPIFISLAGNSSNIWELHRRNLSKNTDRQNEKRSITNTGSKDITIILIITLNLKIYSNFNKISHLTILTNIITNILAYLNINLYICIVILFLKFRLVINA